MSFLQPVRKRPLVAVVLILVIVAALAVTFAMMDGRRPQHAGPQQAAFFDENTNQIVLRDASGIPPLDGGNIVRASLKVADAKKARIEDVQYLYRFTPESKQRLEARVQTSHDIDLNAMLQFEMEGKEVRTLSSGWVSAQSPDGQQIVNAQ